jgi:hypothetical protein
MSLWQDYMYRRERWYHDRDDNRLVRPFEWGLPYILDHVNGDDPRHILTAHAARVLQASDEFYALPEISDYRLEGDQLTWTSAIETPSRENNLARARYFPVKSKNGRRSRKAVVVLPQWNAQPQSHVEACRIFNLIGMAALRLTLPYHQQRKPAELERADHLVCTNIGRTIQSMRQAVLDTRAAVRWLRNEGFEQIGILGTSVGSCIAFLAFAHEPDLKAGAFNHVSARSLSASYRRSTPARPPTRRGLAALRPLHHRRTSVESHRRLENRQLLQKAVQAIVLSVL